jgi:hypothetical protein
VGNAGARGGLSPDGRFVVYAINRSNRNNALVIANVANGARHVIAFGLRPAFSADSKWAAYAVGVSEAEQEQLRVEQKSVQNRLGLLYLAAGDKITLDTIESFAFRPGGAYMASRPYAPEPACAACHPRSPCIRRTGRRRGSGPDRRSSCGTWPPAAT